MTTEDIIIHIFCLVDEQLPPLAKYPQAKLYPSELVTGSSQSDPSSFRHRRKEKSV